MCNEKTTEGLKKLVALSFLIQNMPDRDLVEDKVPLSLAIQEVAKHIGDAHQIDWGGLVSAAIRDIQRAMLENDDAEDLATRAILKAMGHKPHGWRHKNIR